MEILVLGPVEILHDGGRVRLARRQQRLLLGILALQANQVVGTAQLVDLMWGGGPPRQARAVIQTRMSELRTALTSVLAESDADVVSHGDGYQLSIDGDKIDAIRFQRMLSDPAAADADELETLRSALELWRGPVLGGWLPDRSHVALCQRLESARLTAAERLYDQELAANRHHAVVDEVMSLAAANPGRERLISLAMVALHRTGRTAEALLTYERCRRWLADELGVDPNGGLQELHLTLLRGDREAGPAAQSGSVNGEALSPPARPPVTEGAASHGFRAAVPHTLPPNVVDFVGRDAEIKHLSDLLAEARSRVAVVALSGPAGVGKTALCIHVAHRLQATFPDGQMFADLHGVDTDDPATPFDVLGRFLRLLGVDGLAIPSTVDERIDLYRSLLAHRRVLVVLDNAGTADQVQPLIPGTPGSAVLITSRTRLGYAVGGHVVSLSVLSPARAVDLLAGIAGRSRVASEPESTAEMARLCGYLPLAIRVAAARLAATPQLSIRTLTIRLSDDRRRLHELRYGHQDVRSSIGLSFDGLTVEARRLLCLLSNSDLPEVTVWCSAALLDTVIADAEETLEQLYDAQLLEVAGRDVTGHARYRIHDLVRLLARERAQADGSSEDVRAAWRRLLGSWLYIVDTARYLVFGREVRDLSRTASRWTFDEDMAARLVADPGGWCDIERSSIIAMVGLAERCGMALPCWELATMAYPLFDLGRHFDDGLRLLKTALSAVENASDVRGRAAVLCRLGEVCLDRREFAEARDNLHSASRFFEQLGDVVGQAVVNIRLATLERFEDRGDVALDMSRRAAEVLREHGDHLSEAHALRSIGQIYLTRKDHIQAAHYFAEALRACQAGKCPRSEAQVLYWLSVLQLRQGLVWQAETGFQQVLEICQRFGDLPGQAYSLEGLARCRRQRGDLLGARTLLNDALEIACQPRPTNLEIDIRQAMAEFDIAS